MTGLREILKNKFKDPDLTKGVRGALLNSFYDKALNPFYDNNRGLFPYSSLKFLIKALEWPSEYIFVRDYPKEANVDWSNEVNGVANDGTSSYMIQKDRIRKFPLGHSLTDSTGMFQVGIPDDLYKKGYNHFGDSSYYNHPTLGGHLFVPIEGVPIPTGETDIVAERSFAENRARAKPLAPLFQFIAILQHQIIT